jgi:hypothetical protein
MFLNIRGVICTSNRLPGDEYTGESTYRLQKTLLVENTKGR